MTFAKFCMVDSFLRVTILRYSLIGKETLVEDGRKEVAQLVSQLCVTQILTRFSDADAETQLAQARQLGAYLAKTFGYSARDLPPALKTRFDEFGKVHFG